MSDQLASELLKLRTTRTLALLLLAAAAMSLFGVSVEALSRDLGRLAPEQAQRDLFSSGVTIGVFFATLAGLLAVTSEFRYGTIRPTLIVEPRRRVVIAAKLAAAALAGVAFAVVCVGVTFAAGIALLAARDVDIALTGSHILVLVAGPIGAAMVSAMIGVAVGTLIRNQAGAVVALAAYALLVDAVLFAAAPSVGRYLPGKAGDALAGRPDELLLAPGLGAAVLIVWALALLAAATVRNDRSDV
jgi:ABC-type transport system involved in multi-copper enzyme maturation permease subunit